MKIYIQFYSTILLFVFTISCKGQTKTELPKDSTSQTITNSADVNPYFIAAKAKSSSVGPTSITRNILQDRKGNIWLATWEGIIRYDGKTFTNFTEKEGLRRFHVFSILEDSKGNLWFGTIGAGVYRYDGKSFTNFTSKEGLINDRVGCFFEDTNGDIWIGAEGGISIFNGKSFRNITSKDGLSSNDINSIVKDKKGRIWIGARGEACYYDGSTFTKITNKEGNAFVNVRSIIEDVKGNIWLGGQDGLWIYDGTSFTNFTKDFVGYIYEDSKGSIWTNSAANGNSNQWVLSRYDKTFLPYEKTTATPIKAEQNMFFGILEDNEGGIWLGTLNGVYLYDGKSFNNFGS